MPLKRLTDAEIAELLTAYVKLVNGGFAIRSDEGTVMLPPSEAAPLASRALYVLPSLLDEVQRSRALLFRVQWEGTNGNELSVCPNCYGINPSEQSFHTEPSGHKPDCELAALIGK